MARDGDYPIFQGAIGLVFGLTTLLVLLIILSLVFQSRWGEFAALAANQEFRFAVLFSLGTTAIATAAAVLTGVPVAYFLARCEFPGKALIASLLEIPIMLPPLVSGVALLIFFGQVMGDALARMGLDLVFTYRGVIAAQWFVATPFGIKAFRQAFEAVDPRLESMARTLGYSPALVFFKVTLRLTGKSLMGGVTMVWARTLGEFGAVAMLAGITRMQTETLPAAIFLSISLGELDFAVATATVMLVMAFVLLVLLKIFSRGKSGS
jgi:molybdate transport system permease protein